MEIKNNKIILNEKMDKVVIEGGASKVEYNVTLSKGEKLEKLLEELKGYGLNEYEERVTGFFNSCFDWNIGNNCIFVIPTIKISAEELKVYILLWNGTAKNYEVPRIPLKFENGGEIIGRKDVICDSINKPSEVMIIQGKIKNDMGIMAGMNVIPKL